MTIDITAMLSGGMKMPPDGETQIEEDGAFSLELEEKLAEMGLVLPGVMTELLPVNGAAVSASEGALAAAVGKETAASLLPAMPEQEGAPAVLAALTTEEGTASPQWQLQQLITGQSQAVGATERTSAQLVQATTAQAIRRDEGASGEDVKLPKGAAAQATLKTTAEGVATAPQMMASESQQATAVHTAETVQPITIGPVLSTSSRMPAPLSSQSVATIPHALETPEWKQAVSQQVVLMSRNGVQNAEIRLHPEELGSLHITLRLQQEQAKIHIVSDHAMVRQVLEQAIPQLRTAMADSGIQLGQANVSADNPFADRQMNGEHGSGERHASPQSEDNGAEEESVPVVLTPMKNAAYGINTFA
ncbi:flagellar hook-length control protein FliK [Enterobacteriaceae bacterium C23F]